MPTRTTVQASALPFVADRDSLTHDTGGTIDWDNVPEDYRETPGGTVTLAAAANVDDEALTVDALTFAIASGTVLQFGADKYATLAAAAAVGAEALTVEPLVTALADGDTAEVLGAGAKMIPAGTPMNDGATGTSAMVPANTSDAKVLLATNAHEDNDTDSLTGYGKIRGGVIYQNLLPETLTTDAKTALQAAGTGFSFINYSDSTTA